MDKFKELLKLQEGIRTDIEAEPEADAMRKRDALDNMLEKMTECLLAELSKEDRDFCPHCLIYDLLHMMYDCGYGLGFEDSILYSKE